jgi:hypothetical protein
MMKYSDAETISPYPERHPSLDIHPYYRGMYHEPYQTKILERNIANDSASSVGQTDRAEILGQSAPPAHQQPR